MRPFQVTEKGPIASLLQKIQILTYRKYASALNFFAPNTRTFLSNLPELTLSTVWNGRISMRLFLFFGLSVFDVLCILCILLHNMNWPPVGSLFFSLANKVLKVFSNSIIFLR